MIAPVPWPRLPRNLVAILRGVTPKEAVALGSALVESGFDAIEVPLNSPDPFDSIARLAAALPSRVLLGAGTVLTAARVRDVWGAGGKLIVAPNFDAEVVREAARLGMVSMPGVFTPTEALAALAAGASGLKFFPAAALGAEGIAAMRAVLPPDAVLSAVGGVSHASFAAYAGAGVTAFGLGSSLYQPGFDTSELRRRADAAVAAYDAVFDVNRDGSARGSKPSR